MKRDKKSERINTTTRQAENLKITRDPITHYPIIEFFNAEIVLQKGTTVKDLQEKSLDEVTECVL